MVHQYQMRTEPEIPADSAELLFEVFKKLKRRDGGKMGYMCASGSMIFSLQAIGSIKYPVKFKHKNIEHAFDVTVEKTRQLRPDELK